MFCFVQIWGTLILKQNNWDIVAEYWRDILLLFNGIVLLFIPVWTTGTPNTFKIGFCPPSFFPSLFPSRCLADLLGFTPLFPSTRVPPNLGSESSRSVLCLCVSSTTSVTSKWPSLSSIGLPVYHFPWVPSQQPQHSPPSLTTDSAHIIPNNLKHQSLPSFLAWNVSNIQTSHMWGHG